MESLSEFVHGVSGFAGMSHADKIRHFVWYLHTEKRREELRVQDVRECFEAVHLDLPANLARSVDALTEGRPPTLLKKGGSYRMHATARSALAHLCRKPESTVLVESALAELPAKLRNDSERLYLEETLVCYRHQAFRATIVLAWNLAYDHLLHWILANATRVAAFNQGIPKRNPNKRHVTIATRSDFEDLKEDEVVDIAATIAGVTNNMKRSLKEKLGRRNTYAHPSTMTIAKPQVDDMITDLVNNIVLRLPSD